jgi:hypothetical protein
MNNNIFQFNRLGKLFHRTFQQNSKTFLNNALVLAGLPILFLLIARLTSNEGPELLFRSNFLTFLVVTIFIFSPFFYYYFYNHSKKGLSEVMLPASVLEKFVVMQIFCMILAPLMVLVFYGGSDVILSALFPLYQGGYAIVHFFNNRLTTDGVLVVFLSMQAVFFANLFFVRRKILKSIASFIVINLLIAIVILAVVKWMESLGYLEGYNGNVNLSFSERGLFDFYRGDHPFMIFVMIVRILMDIILPILFMIGSYRLMKTNRY